MSADPQGKAVPDLPAAESSGSFENRLTRLKPTYSTLPPRKTSRNSKYGGWGESSRVWDWPLP